MALFCLLGSLLGWGVSLIWPTPHRATRELFVGLNVYNSLEGQNRTEYAGIEIVNANDFKNWQMASLNTLILKDEVIDATLTRLRTLDPYWEGVDRTALADSLDVYWRNAGKWRLVAENTDPQRAEQAVIAWEAVVVERVHTAVLASQRAMVIDLQLKAMAQQRLAYHSRIERLRQAQETMQRTLRDLEALAADAPLDQNEHWKLWRQLGRLDLGPAWKALLDAFPPHASSTGVYRDWLMQATPLVEAEILGLEEQIRQLDEQQQEAAAQFAQASQESLGLSATLDVDKISETRLQQSVVRPTGTLMLAGSLLGLVVWFAFWLGGVSLKGSA
ncbi:MAG: hypothetical protein B6D39_03190 [Anaerolineae bacterium UTCFX2]|jgi:hypothetical protein|nr:hypothetical protein [Anaerolineae bacterium]MCZ7552275.1 hypothetical protein [Anaerolineales bacterium]OQY93264.1 MAG: hypothetical protein B6D39_03190 [Anaerolineae bacterium UTCFX2]